MPSLIRLAVVFLSGFPIKTLHTYRVSSVSSKCPQMSRPAMGRAQPPIQWVLSSFPGVNRPAREVHHPPPFTAQVKKEWSNTSSVWGNFTCLAFCELTFISVSYLLAFAYMYGNVLQLQLLAFSVLCLGSGLINLYFWRY
jgi:hypothetical protein